MSKYYVFSSAVEAGLVVPALIGILTSVVGAFYYLRLIVVMYTAQPEGENTLVAPSSLSIVGGFALAIALIVFGLAPSLIFDWLDGYYAIEQLLVTLP
jgi:NADH-quinone oxidoreductase subunit N